MRDFLALATDGDGTLMQGKKLAHSTIDALNRFRDSGRKVILVTGETARQLQRFPHTKLFDLIVGENGGIFYWPDTGKSHRLADPYPPELVRCLTARKIEKLVVGEVMVSVKTEDADALREAIRECGVPLQIIENRADVMALPDGVDKSFGVCAAVEELGLERSQVVGIGDAENDIALLTCCGFGAAVQTAVPELKKYADLITAGGPGRGVVEVIDAIMQGHARFFSINPTRQRGTSLADASG